MVWVLCQFKTKKKYIFWISGVFINKVLQGSQKNKKYLQFIMGVLAYAAQNADEQFWK